MMARPTAMGIMRKRLKRKKQLMSKLILFALGYMISAIFVYDQDQSDPVKRMLQSSSLSSSSNCSGILPSAEDLIAQKYRTMRGTVMIGIMTTRANLLTRATAISSTWGKGLPALVFYVGEKPSASFKNKTNHDAGAYDLNGVTEDGSQRPLSEKENDDPTRLGREFYYSHDYTDLDPDTDPEPVRLIHDLPVVELKGVADDAYPPRSKCFAMIRHIHHAFGSRFDWIVRADDDLYLHHESLTSFLHSLDNSRLWYIGRPGHGKPEERGKLGMHPKLPYCMGGPGVVFSPHTLRLLVPHLRQCDVEGAVTTHEDTELGRCLLKHLNVSCTAGKKVEDLFRAVFKKGEAEIMEQNTQTFLTLHPIKEPHAMQLFHTKVQLQRVQHLMLRRQQLTSEINSLKFLTEAQDDGTHEETHAAISRFDSRRDLKDFLRAKAVGEHRKAVSVRGIFQRLTRLFPGGGSSISEKEEGEDSLENDILLTDSLLWDCTVVRNDLINILNERNTHKDRLAVTLAETALTAFVAQHNLSRHLLSWPVARLQKVSLMHGLQHLLTRKRHKDGFQTFLLTSQFKDLYLHELSVHSNYDAILLHHGQEAAFVPQEKENPRTDTRVLKDLNSRGRYGDNVSSSWPDVDILMPLLGRYETYMRFLNYTATAASRYAGKVSLLVGLYTDEAGNYNKSRHAAESYAKYFNTTLVDMKGSFSRARTFNKLAEHVLNENDILIFMDVDLVFTDLFLYRCATNVGVGRAYFPVCFSQYAPETVCYGRANCTKDVFNHSEDSGKWRNFGFGMLAIRLGDLSKTGGVNSKFVGWGGEDVDFYQRCVTAGINILRAPDKNLVHVYHPMDCEGIRGQKINTDCRNSRAQLYGSSQQLYQMFLDLQKP